MPEKEEKLPAEVEINPLGLKSRLQVYSEVGKVIPESLKYYGVQYVEGDKVKNISCFSKDEAEQKVKLLQQSGRQVKLVEGIRASGINLLSRYVGIEERLDLSATINNLEQVCARIAEGKPVVLYAIEMRTVEFNGRLFKGTGATAVYVTGNQGLDKLFHSVIAKAETRARARAEAVALGLPIQIAEDLEIASEEAPAGEVIEVEGVEVETPKQTSPEDRAKKIDEIAKQIMPDEKGQKEVCKSLKAKLGITTSVLKAPEEVYRRFISELDKLEKMPKEQEEI